MDEGNSEKISEAIFNLIPEVTRLKELFQSWDLLDDDGKRFIDCQVEKWKSPRHIRLYKTVKEALVKWGEVQDTEGAPGCDPGWYTFSCDTQLEEELVNVLQTVETLLKRVKKARSQPKAPDKTIMEELTNYSDVPPSRSPLPVSDVSDNDDDNFLLLEEEHRSEPVHVTPGRSESVSRGRRFYYYHCHAIRSAPALNDGYNTD